MTEEEIEEGARTDPDNPPWTDADFAAAELVLPNGERRVPVSIRLDTEVLDFFRQGGRGYQTRINAVLQAYVRMQLRRRSGRG